MIRWTAVAFGVLVIATAIAVAITQTMLAPPRGDLIELGLYLFVSGAASMAAGAAVISLLDRRFGLTLIGRFVAVALVTCAVLVVNILVLARLMFISTDHDLQVVLATAAFGAVVAVAFAGWAASTTTARIARINDGIRALVSGDRGIVAIVDGTDEVAALAQDLNMLAARLGEAEAERAQLDAERRELTSAISHDLRTPLSTIRAMVDALEDGVVNEPTEMRRYFATIRRDVERLNRMIDDLFELAQIDAGAIVLRRQSISVDEVVSEVVDAMRARAERAGIAIEFRVESQPLPVEADGDRLERAIANLLRNALEHTPRGGSVTVSVKPADDRVVVDVSDTGDGIDHDDLPHVWTRFYRGERSRTRNDTTADGVGLGLAITKGIVELHGGTVGVRSVRGQGASFEVALPVQARGSG